MIEVNEFVWVTLPRIVLIGLPLVVGLVFIRVSSQAEKSIGCDLDKTDRLLRLCIFLCGIACLLLGTFTAIFLT